MLIFTAIIGLAASCDPDCQVCIGYRNDECVVCGPHAHLAGTLPNKCDCNSGYHRNPDSMHCCHPDCLTCHGPDSDDCDSCAPRAHLSSGHCVCDSNYYCKKPDARNCGCHPNCNTCSGCADDDCLSCYPNAHIYSGDECACNTGFCPTPDAGHCIATCNGNCNTCSGGCDQNKCTSCGTNALLGGGKCSCAANFYPNTDAMHCSNSCDSSCKTCSGALVTQCLTCFGNADLSASNICTCVRGYYPSPDANNCLLCPLLCSACAAGPVCYVCASGSTLSGGSCQCGSGYYPDSGSCKRCDNSCATCSGPGSSACTGCISGWSLALGQCTCPTCVPCGLVCQTCDAIDTSDCKSCFAGARLIATSATQTCDCSPGYFPNSDASSCELCNVTCLTCTAAGALSCSTCYPNATLSASHSCVCNSAFYPSPDASSCVSCDPQCGNCSDGGPSDCSSCQPHASLLVSTCYCDPGYYGTPDNCQLCDVSCLTCSGGTSSDCESCKPLSTLVASSCVCDSNTFQSAGNCVPCGTLCATCLGPAQCLTCLTNAHLAGPTPSTCECLSGYYLSSTGCEPCSQNCQTCSSASVCVTCKPNASLQGSDCACNSGFYGEGNCQPCSTGCEQCLETGCLKCAAGWLALGLLCVASCPACFYMNDGKCMSGDCTPPEPSLVVNLNNSLTVSFTKEMVMNMTAFGLRLDLQDGDGVQYTLSWSEPLVLSDAAFLLELYIKESSLPSQNEVTLAFLEPERVIDKLGIALEKYQVTGILHEFGSTAPTTALNSSTRATVAAMSQGSVGATATASILNGSPTALWSLLNQLQLITYIPLTTIPLSSRFASTLIALNMGEFVPNPMDYMFTGNMSKPPDFAERYGISSTLFLSNVGLMISVAVAIVLSLLPIYALSRVSVEFVAEYFHKMLPSFRWGVFLRWWLQSYLDVGVFALLQLSSPGRWSFSVYLNIAIGAVFTVLFVTTPVFLCYFTWRNYSTISKRSDSTFSKRWGTLFLEFNQQLTSIAYYHVFIFRRCVYAFTLIMLPSYPAAQALINTAMACAVALYVVLCRPFAERMDQISADVLETSTAAIFLLASFFVLDLGKSGESFVETIGVWTVMGAIVVNGLLSVVRSGLMVVDLFVAYNKHIRTAGMIITSRVAPTADDFLFVAPCKKPLAS